MHVAGKGEGSGFVAELRSNAQEGVGSLSRPGGTLMRTGGRLR